MTKQERLRRRLLFQNDCSALMTIEGIAPGALEGLECSDRNAVAFGPLTLKRLSRRRTPRRSGPRVPYAGPTGFAIPGYAAAAARKGHELKLIRQWTADEARSHASAAGHARMARMTPEERREVARRGGLARWKAVP